MNNEFCKTFLFYTIIDSKPQKLHRIFFLFFNSFSESLSLKRGILTMRIDKNG